MSGGIGAGRCDRVIDEPRVPASNPDGRRAIARIVEMSMTGRAPKQDSLLFALATASAVPEKRALALAAIPRVARTGA
jgi:hypothetical protein